MCNTECKSLVAWLSRFDMRDMWQRPLWCTLQGALRQMSVFLDAGFPRYEAARQFADARAVSRLSPYLHFGQLSANVLAAEARRRGPPNPNNLI